ncbi:MAG TPA: type II toxin-antitoxin system RelE/ParE family toxin [Rhodanobacteraceae bacterium]|nr:type II toxin-antitoxin system RelE/ParE family toxin [Rhodanobacteraceae bacterium]
MENVTVRTLPQVEAWLRELRDAKTKARLLKRIRKAMLGNLGDVEPVGGGVYEMREHFGPGWRMYYVQRGKTVIILLAGGSKRTQPRDIAEAKRLANELDD